MKVKKTVEPSGGRHELCLASLLLMSPAAGILLDYADLVSLRASLVIVVPPAVIAAGILGCRASRTWTARLAIYGLFGGLAAALAYDGVRLLLFWLDAVSQPFKSMQLYGLLIVGQEHPRLAQLTGWLFHFWNGATFGMFYALAFGRPTIPKGILWGLILELAQVITSPKLLRLTIEAEFLTSSFVGHIAYGVALAAVVARAAKRIGN